MVRTIRSARLYGPDMDVQRLRVLRAVVAGGSVRGAAATLGYTPSAVSQQLAALQREVGLPLLQRVGRGVEPTPAGRRLASAADGVFEQLARLDALAGDLREGREGALSISYFSSAASAWIPAVLATITREFPGLRLDLQLAPYVEVDSAPPDVEIGVDGAEPVRPEYVAHPLVTEPYLAVVPVGSSWAARESVELGELSGELWVDNDVARGPCRQAVLDACASAGFTPVFHIEAQDYPTAIRFVAEGVGVTVVPELGLDPLPAGVVAVPLRNPTPERSISVRVHTGVADHPAARRVVDLLEQRVARGRGRRAPTR